MHRHSSACHCGPRWPANLARTLALVAGLDPVARSGSAATDLAWSHGMAGRSGAVRTGDGADPAYRFSGYLAYSATAAIPPGASHTLRRSPNIGLPATHGDVRTLAAGSVADHLARVSGNRRRLGLLTPQGA